MPRLLAEPAFRHGTAAKTAVVLINLGTPEAATTPAVRRYLKEFLSDPRVVEIPRALWWLILNGVILRVRPKKSAEKYAAIWTSDGSPLKVHTERQSKRLRAKWQSSGLMAALISSSAICPWAFCVSGCGCMPPSTAAPPPS